jgi:DNA-binding transcriptional MerR regulator
VKVVAVQEAAELTGLSEAQVRHFVQDGKMLPEAVVAGHALWRASTLERWARSERRTFPISPRLEVVGLGDLAVRFGVTPAAIRKWRYEGSLPKPDHTPSGLLLWDESTVQAMTPFCSGPQGKHKVAVVETRKARGKRTEVRCECGAWTEMKVG